MVRLFGCHGSEGRGGGRLASGALVLLLLCGFLFSLQPAWGGSSLTRGDEERIGREIKEELVYEYGRVTYRDSFGLRLEQMFEVLVEAAGLEGRNCTLIVLNTPMINAFSVPGGFIFVTAGLLEFVESSDQLAIVLGHELGHLAADHAIRRLQVQFGLQLLIEIFIDRRDEREKVIGDVISFLVSRGYTREQEYEADELGMLYAHRAGYDAQAAIEFQKMLVDERGPALFLADILSTHPTGERRIEHAREYLQKLVDVESGEEPVAVFASELEPKERIAQDLRPLGARFFTLLKEGDTEGIRELAVRDFTYRNPLQEDHDLDSFLGRFESRLPKILKEGDLSHEKLEVVPRVAGGERSAVLYHLQLKKGGETYHLPFRLEFRHDESYIRSDHFYPGQWMLTGLRYAAEGTLELDRYCLDTRPVPEGEEWEVPRERGVDFDLFTGRDRALTLWTVWLSSATHGRPVTSFVEVGLYRPDGQRYQKEVYEIVTCPGMEEVVLPIVLHDGRGKAPFSGEDLLEYPGEWKVILALNGEPLALFEFEVGARFRLDL